MTTTPNVFNDSSANNYVADTAPIQQQQSSPTKVSSEISVLVSQIHAKETALEEGTAGNTRAPSYPATSCFYDQ